MLRGAWPRDRRESAEPQTSYASPCIFATSESPPGCSSWDTPGTLSSLICSQPDRDRQSVKRFRSSQVDRSRHAIGSQAAAGWRTGGDVCHGIRFRRLSRDQHGFPERAINPGDREGRTVVRNAGNRVKPNRNDRLRDALAVSIGDVSRDDAIHWWRLNQVLRRVAAERTQRQAAGPDCRSEVPAQARRTQARDSHLVHCP